MSRRQIAPGVWVPEPPSSALIRHRTYAVETVEVIGSMRPILTHARYMENRHRVKPPNPLSIHVENRR